MQEAVGYRVCDRVCTRFGWVLLFGEGGQAEFGTLIYVLGKEANTPCHDRNSPAAEVDLGANLSHTWHNASATRNSRKLHSLCLWSSMGQIEVK